MALAGYDGPPSNHVYIMEALIGETVKAAFVDKDGRIWLVSASGHAITFAGLNTMAPAWSVEPPHVVQNAVETRRAEVRSEIAKLKRLVPGIEV